MTSENGCNSATLVLNTMEAAHETVPGHPSMKLRVINNWREAGTSQTFTRSHGSARGFFVGMLPQTQSS